MNARDRSVNDEVYRLREWQGAEADEGRPRKPAIPLAGAQGIAAKGPVPPLYYESHLNAEAAGSIKK